MHLWFVSFCSDVIYNLNSQGQLCHPQAVCHDAQSWPVSWCLDPTEGPNRERRRLQLQHLSIDSRFLLPSEKWKLTGRQCSAPLSRLLDRMNSSSRDATTTLNSSNNNNRSTELAGLLIDGLRIDEKIVLAMSAMILRSTFECTGEMLLGDHKFYFVGESSRSTQVRFTC